GMFREVAHDERTLFELATRLDAGLGRGMGRHEEFVTALLVEIDPESGYTSVFNCGHPSPLLIQAADDAAPGSVTLVEVAQPAPPLGLLALGDCAGAQLSVALRPNDQLLLYTDGVTEARDARRAFYPLPERIAALAARAAAGHGAGRPAAGKTVLKPVSAGTADGGAGGGGRSLLDLVRADL